MDDVRKLRFLTEFTAQINLANSVEDLVGFLYQQLREFLPYNRIAVGLLNSGTDRLTVVAVQSDGKMVVGKGHSVRLAESTWGPLVSEGRSQIINDLPEHLRQNPGTESARKIIQEGMRSRLLLPLSVQGRTLGVMFFSSRQAGAYRPEHEEFLRGIANQIAVAVDRVRLLD